MSLIRLAIRVRAADAEAALADLLPVLGGGADERTVGGAVEYGLYGVDDELPDAATVRALVGDALVDVRREPVPEGWERRWHAHLRPVRVGRLTVRPPWLDGEPDDLVVDPDVWFGAGTHPTTRLCLELLQAVPVAGALCDWGAGTGVLALAAARLGHRPVTAVERDAGALATIRANAARNDAAVAAVAADVTEPRAHAPAAATRAGDEPGEGRGPREARAAAAMGDAARTGGAATVGKAGTTGEAGATGLVPWAATVTANLTRPVLVGAARAVARAPARLVASGMLEREVDEVVAAFRARGMRVAASRSAEGWAAVVLEGPS